MLENFYGAILAKYTMRKTRKRINEVRKIKINQKCVTSVNSIMPGSCTYSESYFRSSKPEI
jgi:hypothetical protein